MEAPHGHEEFVSEALRPVGGPSDLAAMARGEPGLPRRFAWRGTEYRVAGVVRRWTSSGPDRGGGAEIYLRRHWYQLVTQPQAVMTIYCERQPRSRKRAKARWWIYTIQRPAVRP